MDRRTARLRAFVFGAVMLGGTLGGPASAAPPPPKRGEPLRVYPPQVRLDGPDARQRLVIEGGAGATSRVADPRIATLDADGRVRGLRDGDTLLITTRGGEAVRTPLRVRGSAAPRRWSFVRHVLPVLTRYGCNSGACHGAAAGKGGLKLSLRGYDPTSDQAALTRQAGARRVNPVQPEKSLLLGKATMSIPHGGGRRFELGSEPYRWLVGWIRAGGPAPRAGEPLVEALEVFPPRARLGVGNNRQFVVRARYADGTTADVTDWVRFGSSDETVASVDERGRVRVAGSGETAITAGFATKVAFARVTSPFKTGSVSAAVLRPAPERRNLVDDQVLAKLSDLGLKPASIASDEGFIRRAYLAAAGILPTEAEVKALQDAARQEAPNGVGWAAREAVVDRLLARPEFVDYWTYRWSDLLLISSRKLPTRSMRAFYGWVRDQVGRNTPWDRMVREIITASGSTLQNGAANYYVLHKDPIDLTETTSQAFLGMSLTCARCHNHPLEKWTQTDYYGMVNLFSRVRMKNGEVNGETLVHAVDTGDISHPRTGLTVPPRPLDGSALEPAATADRRAHLADWLTSPNNPYFARALVNRVWRTLMGRGIVEPEDDLRLTNPPTNEGLMAALEADFVKSGYDVRRLIRTILTSATFQRSAEPAKGSLADSRFFSHYIPTRLPAEVLLDALSGVTAVPTEFVGYPIGTRALQLPDSLVASNFLTAFGRPLRAQTCSCERQEEPNVAQALHLANGDTVNEKLRAPNGAVARLLTEETAAEALVKRTYRLVLGRDPVAREQARMLAAAPPAGAPDRERREWLEDLFAALLTSKEFLFLH